jgi:hypothetical protein
MKDIKSLHLGTDVIEAQYGHHVSKDVIELVEDLVEVSISCCGYLCACSESIYDQEYEYHGDNQ